MRVSLCGALILPLPSFCPLSSHHADEGEGPGAVQTVAGGVLRVRQGADGVGRVGVQRASPGNERVLSRGLHRPLLCSI